MRGAGRRADALWPLLLVIVEPTVRSGKVLPATHAKWGRGLKALVDGLAQDLGHDTPRGAALGCAAYRRAPAFHLGPRGDSSRRARDSRTRPGDLPIHRLG